MLDFIADFICGILEMLTEPWIDKLAEKWKKRKRKG